jgi:hypothetical protein
VAEAFDPLALVARFRERAKAVRDRGIPPIEGPERRRFIEQAQLDYMDFAIIGDAEASLEDGVLVLRVDLRPPAAKGQQPGSPA